MYARYLKGKQLVLIFTLEGYKETDFAYLFMNGGNNRVKATGEVGEKLRAMEEALKWEVIEHNEKVIEAEKHPLCIRCCMEIDKEKELYEETPDGNFQHKEGRCPPLKDANQRNL